MKNLLTEIFKLKHSHINEDVERYTESDIFWATKRNKNFINKIIRIGEIYQFEFGKNYVPEMSYEHRGLVIGVSKRLLYVLPIYSFNKDNESHLKAYGYKNNTNKKSKLYFLDEEKYPFLERNSVLKLDDLRTVSTKRIKYKHNGAFDKNSDTYKEIVKIAFSNCFPAYAYEYDKLTAENKILKEEIEKLNKIITNLNTLDKE